MTDPSTGATGQTRGSANAAAPAARTITATVESATVEPGAVESTAVGPAAVEPSAVGPAAVRPAAVEPAAPGPAGVEPAVAAKLAASLERRALGDVQGAQLLVDEAAAKAGTYVAGQDDGGPNAATLANLALVQGLVAAARGDTEAALELLAAAAGRAERAPGELGARLRLHALIEVGALLRDRGAYLDAEFHLRGAVEAATGTAGLGPADVGRAWNELGITLRYRGRHDEAADCYGRARALLTAVGGEGPPRELELELATVDHNLGGLAHARGDLAAAEHASRRAFDTRRRLLGDEHPATVGDLGALAAVVLDRGRVEEAVGMLEGVLRAFERIHGSEHYEVAVALHNLGTAYFLAGDRPRAAAALRRGLALKRRALHGDHPDLASTACNLAAVHLAEGDTARAADLWAEGARVLRGVVAPDHPTLRTCLESLAALREP
ncbi:tetratricopeptide repeat protein [Frankia sp. CNm7]|uniref:Tetratricopeptide repeat protein n=1 Tax=Frankia nepalensis TaxID=1836974 RepID=A0A937UKJ2_9ACTN|nr:tetratricopeptide repeat protein [Frankia nepalensis]MBL7497174.1 tetratricopeptide repeat protein [Frankia nepalensis]MBL7513116.1 tetratricopeptide repeat protein [Frankia nepalensis]MBL7518331.1 tetratricopeptide repeat protein [Frankia nepalensis]MBL7626879.1 tetratricopeptide repeat protein [Frankia nepalensis]